MSSESSKPDISPKGARVVSPKGARVVWQRGEDEGARGPRKEFCFVIMSYSGDPVLESYYEEAIKPAVEKLGLDCIRVDREHYQDRISERIRENIKGSVAIIVDLTEDRPNCYFEAGYAVALNEAGLGAGASRPIIFQRLNAPPKYEPVIHFDVKDYPFILYTTVASLRRQLREKLKALLGR